MGRLLGAAIVPSAPLLHADVVPQAPAEHRDAILALRQAAADAVEHLPASEAVLLIASGIRGVHVRARVDLRALGIPEVVREHPVAAALLPDLTSRAQYAQRLGDDLDVDLAMLALQLPAGTPVVPIAVATAGGEPLAATGRAIAVAIERSDLAVTLLCAGDLSAALTEASPRHQVDGAAEWDARVVTALAEGDLAGLVARQEGAARVHARSWAPLVVGMAAARAAGLSPRHVTYHTVRGVGHAVGRLAP